MQCEDSEGQHILLDFRCPCKHALCHITSLTELFAGKVWKKTTPF